MQTVFTIVFYGFILGSLCDVIASVLHSEASDAIDVEASRMENRNKSRETGSVGMAEELPQMTRPMMRPWM